MLDISVSCQMCEGSCTTTGTFSMVVKDTSGVCSILLSAGRIRSPTSPENSPIARYLLAIVCRWVPVKYDWYEAEFSPVHSWTTALRSRLTASCILSGVTAPPQIWVNLECAGWSLFSIKVVTTDVNKQSPSPSISISLKFQAPNVFLRASLAEYNLRLKI